MDIDLTQLNEDELVELNHRVVERLRHLRQTRSDSAMRQFLVGDRVAFQPECGHEVVGTVVRLNRKTVTVMSSDSHPWRVAPSFLTRVQGEAGLEEKPLATLISLAEHRSRRDA